MKQGSDLPSYDDCKRIRLPPSPDRRKKSPSSRGVLDKEKFKTKQHQEETSFLNSSQKHHLSSCDILKHKKPSMHVCGTGRSPDDGKPNITSVGTENGKPAQEQVSQNTNSAQTVQHSSCQSSTNMELELLTAIFKKLSHEIMNDSDKNIPFVKADEISAEPGDIIEIHRGVYFHYALYILDGRVVHVSGDSVQISDFSLGSEAFVKEDLLANVVQSSLCRVNNKTETASKKGLTAQTKGEIVKAAKDCIGKTVYYNVLSKNCETYVTLWRYGQGWSEQTDKARKFMFTLLGLMTQFDNLGEVIVNIMESLKHEK